MHTAINQVIAAMVGSLMSKSHKNPLTQYSNHGIDCSVQCMRWGLEIVKLMLVAMVLMLVAMVFAAVSELINGCCV